MPNLGREHTIAAASTDQFDGFLAFWCAPSRNYHFGSRLREKYGGLAANTRRSTGHEPNFALQFPRHSCLHE